MSLLKDLLHERCGLDDDTVDHLQVLISEWQILADLSFADLLLWVPQTLPDGTRAYLCVGQMRPYTAQTIYADDLVGQAFPLSDRPMVGRAFAEERLIRDADPDWSTGVPVREEAIPVRYHGRIVAAVTREANVATARSPSQLELTYLHFAGELAQMLTEGTFPYEGSIAEEREYSPRVGDGIMRLDHDGTVNYASPNAISAYRRLGSLESVSGQHIAEFDVHGDELIDGLCTGRPVENEVEALGAVVLRRLLPLQRDGQVIGALLLVREVTELRRHERALRVKDATIREIHHRVKNNLQTIASLLRLQARRLHSAEARAALSESVRRISSIALVHETLSQESREGVHFDTVARQIVDMLGDGLLATGSTVSFDVQGDPGELPAEVATPLALVLTELVQNCLKHAFPARDDHDGPEGGKVVITFERAPATLRAVVADNGVGLPSDESLDAIANLGLQIARTLISSDLGGTFEVSSNGGTTVELVVPLP